MGNRQNDCVSLALKTMPRLRLTVRQLRQSGLIGLWKDRDDIQDSATYARHLREQAQKRRHHFVPGLQTIQPYKKLP